MGCSASKGSSTHKRSARESWYAPVSRCASAPIHYVPEAVEEPNHYEGSPSTLYSFLKREASTRQGSSIRTSLASILLEEDELPLMKSRRRSANKKGTNAHIYHAVQRDVNVYTCKSRKSFAPHTPRSVYNSKLNLVKEVSESDACDVETINTWELMQGLDEDDGSRTLSPMEIPLRQIPPERSMSFNTVHGLDSCFAEMGSPIWRRLFAPQEIEAAHEKLSFERTSFDKEENKLGANQNGGTSMSPLKSPMQSPVGSPWRMPVRGPLKSPIWSPFKCPSSPLFKSPIRSPFKSPSSPLFDPSLLAKFEQAIEAVVLPHDEWMHTHYTPEESMTTSSPSFNNNTWASSETNSDGDSTQSIPKESPPLNYQPVSPWIKDVNVSCELESFEHRCPPKGEDKVVLYFTSLRGVRKTYEDCCMMRLILQGLGVRVDERDVWMHLKFREELTELLDNKRLQVPKLFIKGRYIGGMEDVRQLHENGYLMRLVEGMPCFGLFRKACEGCADVRFVLCFTCRGSCKVLSELADRVIRCGECNENGLIMCPLCS